MRYDGFPNWTIRYRSERDPSELSCIYEQTGSLVGMRLTWLNFPLRIGTPVIGVYQTQIGRKIEGTVRVLGFSRWVMRLTQDSAATSNATV